MSDLDASSTTAAAEVSPSSALGWRHVRTGTSWLRAIAGFTLVNTLAFVAGYDFRMLIGLGATQVVTAVAWGTGAVGTIVAIAATIIGVGGFLVLAVLARRASRPAFIIGIALYAADALLVAWLGDLIGAAFHVLGLWYLWLGLSAVRGKYGPVSAEDAPPFRIPRLREAVSPTLAYAMIGIGGVVGLGMLWVAYMVVSPGSSDTASLVSAQEALTLSASLVACAFVVALGIFILRDHRRHPSQTVKAIVPSEPYEPFSVGETPVPPVTVMPAPTVYDEPAPTVYAEKPAPAAYAEQPAPVIYTEQPLASAPRKPASVASRVFGWLLLVSGALALALWLGFIAIAFSELFNMSEGLGTMLFMVLVMGVAPIVLFGTMTFLGKRMIGRPSPQGL